MHCWGMEKTASATGQESTGRRRTRAEWVQITQEWKDSGLKADAYAAAIGVNPRTFEWWIRELGKRRRAEEAGASGVFNGTVPTFLPLRTVSEAQSRRTADRLSIEIDFANGRRIRFQVGGDADLTRIAAVVDAAEGQS